MELANRFVTTGCLIDFELCTPKIDRCISAGQRVVFDQENARGHHRGSSKMNTLNFIEFDDPGQGVGPQIKPVHLQSAEVAGPFVSTCKELAVG
jgi:hypothetical protein